jgi:uncharacterized membrane protein YphA (DoxX/SURF4 family)
VADIGALLTRLTIGYVYLYALYLNVKPENRDWLMSHTALLFPPRTRRLTVVSAAWLGMVMMFFGGLSILLGAAVRLGCVSLVAFTALGIYQHRKELQLSIALSEALAKDLSGLTGVSTAACSVPTNLAIYSQSVDFPIRLDSIGDRLTAIGVEAASGQLSSGLKNWGLAGVCMWLGLAGSGRFSVDALVLTLNPNLDLWHWISGL